ncbi:hypothetical protein SAMN05443428_1188 [Caloramator quimbayensis]|uniref:Uncharacterized protein n=1 Tax=Caloramator quimbayensis TaxID=1147123 RepID=A0A1T4Y0K4_9CLOT|nr:hypothetical protein [Caloramator quimbayensis]SKA95332.1 hypothetical protein SAMN05443428_1188 [Caloramator quimbayensis]
MSFNEEHRVISLCRKKLEKRIDKIILFFDKLNFFLRETKDERQKNNYKTPIAH